MINDLPEGKTHHYGDGCIPPHVEPTNEWIADIVREEHYKLEEWYASHERPAQISTFEANQRNIATRNIILQRLKNNI